MTAEGLARPVLLYSGTWRFCRWAARLVAWVDRHEQLALLPLANEDALRLLDSVPEERRSECWWLVLRDGTPMAGDQGGGVALLLAIQRTRPVGLVLKALRCSRALDAVDALLARHRKRLGRVVPDGPAPRRYP